MSWNVLRSGIEHDALDDYRSSTTFSCNHKVTKSPICASPCNGIEELCENDTDEQCQGKGIVFVLPITLVFVVIVIVGALLEKKCNSKKPEEPNGVLEMNQDEHSNENDISILKIKLATSKFNLDFKGSIQEATKFYQENLKIRSDIHKFLFLNLDTTDLTEYFYDCIDGSITMRIGLLLQEQFPKLITVWVRWKMHDIYDIIVSIITISIRYSDLPKDTFFLYLVWIQLGNYSIGSFPNIIFWTLASSIIMGEIVHNITITLHQQKCEKRKALSSLVTPLMPAYFMYKHLQIKLKLNHLWQTCDEARNIQSLRAHQYKMKLSQLDKLTAEMQSTENVFENLTLTTIMMMIILLSSSRTRSVENIDNIFLEQNEFVELILVAMSFFTMIRGQYIFLKANKNGCLGLKATFFVMPYFLLGICSR